MGLSSLFLMLSLVRLPSPGCRVYLPFSLSLRLYHLPSPMFSNFSLYYPIRMHRLLWTALIDTETKHDITIEGLKSSSINSDSLFNVNNYLT